MLEEVVYRRGLALLWHAKPLLGLGQYAGEGCVEAF